MKIEFMVEGSKGDAYLVSFERKGTNLNAYCTCPAGQNGLYCKHRFALMDGVTDSVISDNSSEVALIKTLMDGTDVEVAYREVLEAATLAEEANEELKRRKKRLARAMYR